MQRREGDGEAMVRGKEAWRGWMERWEGQRADADNDGRDKEAPAVGGDALGQQPQQPPHGGDPSLDLTGGRDDPPRGGTGGGEDNR
jgi:hypothetical protein